jgi:signal transduction histidine kinase
MKGFLFNLYSGPLVALGVLVAVACLAGSWYINRLQSELARAVSQDAAGAEAAFDLQLQLRHLRIHSLVLFADPTKARKARRETVQDDLARVDAALKAIERTATAPDDAELAKQIAADYAKYRQNLQLDRLAPRAMKSDDVVKWSDSHHMRDLLAPCIKLADRQRERMQASLERSQSQTAWAGRVLLGLGCAGVLAGLMSGYFTARALMRRVARLSIRVQAVQAHLDQEVGAMTVQGPARFGDLDQQLDRVVDRVSAVCQRLQEQERELLRAEQLAAVGELAAEVAHEVRNPLTGVKFLLQAAVRSQNPTPLTADRLHLLLQEVARIERTVQGLMDFAHAGPRDLRLHDVRTFVQAAVEVAQSRAERKGVSLTLQSSHEPLHAAIDSDQFLSVLTNLLFNAIDATPSGGDVAVSTELRPADMIQGSMIQIDVLDSGAGIDRSLAGKLFTPFATTKPTGTGLGLTLARRVAREHGGDLTAADRPDGGACFTLTLPISEESHAEAAGH